MLPPRLALLVFLLGFAAHGPLCADLTPEAGRFLITSYSAKAYGASPLNLAITQDLRGVMYFGNSDGVLEYDGVTWRHIPVENGIASALARDARGVVYVGGDGVIGYLKPDRAGAMQFVSLADSIPPPDRKFGITLSILATPEGVYFISSNRLFLVQADGQVNVWLTTGSFRRLLFRAFGRVYLADSATGLLNIEDQRLIPCEWGSVLRDDTPLAAVPWNDGVLIASRQRLYRLQKDSIRPFLTEADDYFSQNQISALNQLSNGDLMIGTRAGGFVVLGQERRSIRIVNKAAGLPSNRVLGLFANSHGVVWVATDAGLASFLPALNSFSELEGITGSVYSLGRLNGVLYAGSTAGLYWLRDSPSAQSQFQSIAAIRNGTTVWAMEHTGDTSLLAADTGIYSISGEQLALIHPSQAVYDLHFSKQDPGTLYTAGRDGILVLHRDGPAWNVQFQERGNGQDFRTVAEDADGRVWATTRVDAWRFDFRTSPTKIERFDRKQGLPEGWKNVYRFRNHIVFATDKGLMQFSESQRRFVPDTELGTQFSDGSKAVFLLQEDPRHNVWISGKGYHGYFHKFPSGREEWIEMPLLASGIEDIWALHVDDDGTVWASGSEGSLFRWAPRQATTVNQDFQVLIRRISVAESNTTLFGGSGPSSTGLKVPFAQNALRFEFAAPFFEEPSAVQYQFRLNGNAGDWSPWTKESHKDFTNLPPHQFLFHVRAKSPHGAISPEAVFLFRVLPPWYRTWWAYVLYVFALTAISRLVIHWRLQALRAHNQQLERIVEERTVEVRSQRDQNEALLLNILPAPVASELRESGSVTPMSFDDVTVCFTDFVGFTLSSEDLPAGELVTALNDYFTAFDGIMDRYGLEKLKTIGDSYMFVSGLPERRPSHAVDAVLAALEFVHIAQELGKTAQRTSWKMRVGLYSGPVVAGVVGKSKFAFDVWGSTVNLASRMESSGAPNRVNISTSTWNQIRGLLECEPRGFVSTKEGRALEMFFAVGPKPELLDSSVVKGVPAAFSEMYQAAFSYPPRAFPEFLLQSRASSVEI